MIDTLQGICITCNDGPTCVRRKSHGKPVWYCEEFDDYTPPPIKSAVSDSILAQDDRLIKSLESKTELTKYSGLCVNCEKRENCSFAKLGSEIWQCNEYM